MAYKAQTQYAVRSLALCALFVALIAAGAFIRIPVFGIPYTLQTLFTVLAGLLLGANRGVLAVGAYILIGLAGLPVFANGGGIGYVLQPTFGYILGFLFGTYITGRIAHRVGCFSVVRCFWAGLAGVMILYIIGMIYYFIIVNFYLNTGADVKFILVNCFLVTLPADVFKCFAAAILAKRIYPAVKVYLDKPGDRPYD